MKKFFCLMFAMALIITAVFSFESVVFASDEKNDLGTRLETSDTYYKYDGATKTLYINGTGDVPNLSNDSVSIPWSNWDDDSIKNVVVSEGITSLGNYLFYGVAASSFSLPRTLKRIGSYTFSYTAIKNLDIPYGVEQIDYRAFYYCMFMESVRLPSTLKRIETEAFYQCKRIKSLTIPSSVTYVGTNAFYNCIALSEVYFSSMTQSVNLLQGAFMNCTSLKRVDLPMNIKCNMRSLGYNGKNDKAEGFTLGVYEDTLAQNYAIGNGFDYVLLDSIPIKCGVEYKNTFTKDNINSSFHYTFTPDKTQEYAVYSLGECDTYAKLYCNGELIAENDDIDVSINGFGIKQKLEAGKTYDLYVMSVKMTGDYSVRVYPTEVNGLNIYNGKISFLASDGEKYGDGRIFKITKDMISDFMIDVSFADGTTDTLYYAEYVAGERLKTLDNQEEEPFVCGDNEAKLSLGKITAAYTVHIDHSYDEKYIEPTPDDDGYTLHTCVLCGESFKDNFVATNPYIVTGKCVMAEDVLGSHPHNVPYSYVYINADGRRYNVNPDGTWAVKTFKDCFITFENYYGRNIVKKIEVSKNGNYDFGTVALVGYDLNGDGRVNAKDYAIFYKERKEELGNDYWQFGNEFLISYKEH